MLVGESSLIPLFRPHGKAKQIASNGLWIIMPFADRAYIVTVHRKENVHHVPSL